MKSIQLPACYLALNESGPFQPPFDRNVTDYERFVKWFTILVSPDNPSKFLGPIVDTYRTMIELNEEAFDLSCFDHRFRIPLHQQIYDDIDPIIRDIRINYDLPTMEAYQKDEIYDVFSRILIYAHLNQIKYQKHFFSLLIPIFHVYYYGIMLADDMRFQLPNIEAYVAHSFVRFLSSPPFMYNNFFVEAKIIAKTTAIIVKNEALSLMDHCKSLGIDVQPFLIKWIQTLFVGELVFEEVIQIWEHIFNTISDKRIEEIVSQLIFGLFLDFEEYCLLYDEEDTLDAFNELDSVTAEDIFEKINIM